MAIEGILVDGVWVDEPARVKEEFHLFYSSFFSKQCGRRHVTNSTLFCSLSDSQVQFLQVPFSYDEIKRAV